jgi:hypothetical protein
VPDRSCGEVHDITKVHLEEVKDKIARFTVLRDELEAMVPCDHRLISDCQIIEVMADHGQCRHPQYWEVFGFLDRDRRFDDIELRFPESPYSQGAGDLRSLLIGSNVVHAASDLPL